MVTEIAKLPLVTTQLNLSEEGAKKIVSQLRNVKGDSLDFITVGELIQIVLDYSKLAKAGREDGYVNKRSRQYLMSQRAKTRHINCDERIARRQELASNFRNGGMDNASASQEACEQEEKEEKKLVQAPKKKVKCWGEAHSNPHIDHCQVCEPHWGYVMLSDEEIKKVEANFNMKLEIVEDTASQKPKKRDLLASCDNEVEKLIEQVEDKNKTEKCKCGHDKGIHWTNGACMEKRTYKNGNEKWCACKKFKKKLEKGDELESKDPEKRRVDKLNQRKKDSDKFDKSRPNNVKIMKKYGLDALNKVEHCEECGKKQLIQFEPADPDTIAHWECNECGCMEDTKESN